MPGVHSFSGSMATHHHGPMSGHMFGRAVNRRIGPDRNVQLSLWSAVFSWVLIVLAWALVEQAAPESSTLFHKLFDLPVRGVWNLAQVKGAIFLSMVAFIVSVAGLILNISRLKRNKDHLHPLLVLAVVTSFSLGVGFAVLF
ncbi:MAG: hypothetical protein HQL54_09990 [Magnetococcales bacterium]|nr:hypothetical protein [Magnetococcales bacterium]